MKTIVQLFFALVLGLTTAAQTVTTQGKEFFVSFYRNPEYDSPNEIKLFLTSPVNTTGTITNPNTGFNQPFTIPAGSVTVTTIPFSEAYNSSSGVVNNLGLIITAADTISAYALSSEPYTSDATTILQKGALGTDYLVASYNGFAGTPSCFLIEATEDNTTVQITPTVITQNGNAAGVPFSVTLNKAQTYYVVADGSTDLSGSLVSVTDGCKPIAVFSGAQIADVPVNYYAADILYEQLFPINSFGKQFITAPLKGRNVYRARVYAAYNNTIVHIDGSIAATISAGGFYEFESPNEPRYIETSNPVQVMLFAPGHDYDIMFGPDNNGDPTMITVPPIEQKIKESIFLSPTTGVINNHEVTIVCKTADAPNTLLDGGNIGASFTAIAGNPLYSYAALDISAGQHTIDNSNGFIAYAYGFGNYQGYGYCTGSSVEKINTYFINNHISSIGGPTVDVCTGISDFDIVTSAGDSSYTWDFGDGTAPVTTNGTVLHQSHKYITPGKYIVKLTATDSASNTCSLNATTISQLTLHVVSSITPSLNLVASPAGIVCQGTPINFVATAVNGGTNPVYQWKVNNVNTGTNSPTFTSSTLQNNDVVSCTLTSSFSCATNVSASASLTVHISTGIVPVVTISIPNSTICSGNPATFTAAPGAGLIPSSYQWKVNGFNTGAGNAVFSYFPRDGDIVTCVLTVSNGCALNNTAMSNAITLTVINAMGASVTISTASNPICANSNVLFTATSANEGSNPVYQWKVNGINVGSNSVTYSNALLHNNDIISCVLTSNSTCGIKPDVTSNTIVMQVNPTVIPTINITTAAASYCVGDMITFTAAVTGTGFAPVYQWKVNGNNAGNNTTTYSSNNLVNGDIVLCVLNSNARCAVNPAISNSITVNIKAIVNPSIVINASQNPVCEGDNVRFLATSADAGNDPVYMWTLNGSTVKSTSNNFYASSTLKDGDRVNCQLVSSLSCAAAALGLDITVKVYPAPSVSFNPAEVVIPYGSVYQLKPVVTGNIDTYLWTPSKDLNNTTVANPLTSALEDITYQLTVTTPDNCSASSNMKILVFKDFTMPSAFTPNGDGNNDQFRIPPMHQKNKINYFTIFNRWGEKIFSTTDPSRGWDGTINGTLQNSGVYVWLIEYQNPITNKWVLLKGTTALIR